MEMGAGITMGLARAPWGKLWDIYWGISYLPKTVDLLHLNGMRTGGSQMPILNKPRRPATLPVVLLWSSDCHKERQGFLHAVVAVATELVAR